MPRTLIKYVGKFHSLLFLSPLIVFIVVFTLAPIVKVFFLSLVYGESVPSLGNFVKVFSHYQFIDALRNTFAIVLVGLTLELLMGFGLALLLTSAVPMKRAIRALVLLPLGIPTIIVAANMRQIFDNQGFLNRFLVGIGALETGIDWISSPVLATMATVVSDMWKVTPLVMLIFLAGIEAISTDLIKAARIDGATYWQTVRKIIMPLLIPSLNMAIVIRGIDCFRIFELPLTLFGRSFPVLSSYAYFEYVEGLNPHTSAAASVILLGMIVLSLVLYFLLLRRKERQWATA